MWQAWQKPLMGQGQCLHGLEIVDGDQEFAAPQGKPVISRGCWRKISLAMTSATSAGSFVRRCAAETER